MIRPHILVVPELRCEYTLDLARKTKEWGGKVVVRLCEMGITKESIKEISTDYRDAIFGNYSMRGSVDLMLAWGKNQVSLIRKYTDIEPEVVKGIGGIAFDQYSYPLTTRYNKTKPVILLATGFPYADRNTDFAIPEAKCGQGLHKKWVETGREGRMKWIKMIRLLYAYFGDKYHFRILPHPGEKPDVYQSTLKGIGEIVTTSSAFIEVNIADIVVHAGSTIGYEAHLLKKPAFNYMNVCEDVVASKLSPNINSPLELIGAIESVGKGSNADPRIARKLTTWYYGPVDGKATIRCVDEIDKIEVSKKLTYPEQWPKTTEPLDNIDKDIVLKTLRWYCSACCNSFFVTNMKREMVKCPYCGISCVKMPGPDAKQQNNNLLHTSQGNIPTPP
jgi:surface carbohydrate biosynthesis protein